MINLIHTISAGESSTLEFKTNFCNEAIETIVAFANAKGGKVLIGVSNDGAIVGTTLNEETVQNWINEIKQKTTPTLIPDVDTVEIEEKNVVVLTIQEYPLKPVSYRGRYFKRTANANHLLGVSEVVNIHLQTFNSSWDYHTNNHFKLEDISFEKIQLAIDSINENGVNISESPLNFLLKKDLIRGEKLTNAAFLLFTANDTVMTTIEMGRFQTDIIIKDTARSQTDIISQVDQVLNFVKKHMNKAIIFTGDAQNTQQWQYPMEAIREIVMNMIVHRDYREAADSIIKIYDDKIEFFNPGRLPDDITEEDLMINNYKSTPRNKIIADIFRSMGLIEKYGSGIQRIINYFKEAKLPKPTFKNQSNGFVVTVFAKINNLDTQNVPRNVPRNAQEMPQEKRLQLIIQLIKKDTQISMLELSKKIGVTHKTIKRDIGKLKIQGVLKRIGPTKGGYWKITEINNYINKIEDE